MACRVLLFSGFCLLLGLNVAARAEVMVPEKAQVPIFLKLLTYDRSLTEDTGKPIQIGVLAQSETRSSGASAKAFLEALESMRGKTINGRAFEVRHLGAPDELSQQLAENDIDILYVADGSGSEIETIRNATRQWGVLTLSGSGEMAKQGLSLGIGLRDGRPRILVNLEALEEEGHVLDARVLRLCEVVTGP